MATRAKRCKYGRRIRGKCPTKTQAARRRKGPRRETRAERYWAMRASDSRWEFNWANGNGWNEVYADTEAEAWRLAQVKGREFGLTPVRSSLHKNYYGTYVD